MISIDSIFLMCVCIHVHTNKSDLLGRFRFQVGGGSHPNARTYYRGLSGAASTLLLSRIATF